MTEKQLREKVCEQAKSWLGCAERDGSHKKIIDMYNTIRPLPRGYKVQYNDAWCATYVSAVAQALGMTDIIFPECGCEPMVRLYQKAGRWVEDDNYMPQKGDIVFYDWQDSGSGDCTGTADHVGIVWSAYDMYITVIEGNKSDMVAYRDIKRNGQYIRGFGIPNYASKATEQEPVQEQPKPAKTCQVTLPILAIGDDSEAVRAMQYMLEKRGFRCGFSGADGEFGPKTLAALKLFQDNNGIEVDGECGEISWTVLIVGVKGNG